MSEADIPDNQRPKIKVTDRRSFDSDGNLRDEAPVPSTDDPVSEPVSAAAPMDSNVDEATGSPSSAPEPRADDIDPVATDDPAPEDTPSLKLDDQALLKFIEEQYVGGLLALGAMPEPQSGQMVEDLDLARLRVEVLALLQESTEGARSSETSKALEDVLYQLRMVYLQKRKVAKL
ncbi:MAG TPA: DUF1844 domain-containing protein [Acidobacteriota bacterium]|nr:DUF1844 domain-containing protein [Acidobacteriota bacterium]